MSRPSGRDARRLEQLEGASALLAQALDATGRLTVRMRQIWRRAPELGAVIEPADRELALVVDHCDQAQVLLEVAIAEAQARRTAADAGRQAGERQ